jgi:hypothetical protein
VEDSAATGHPEDDDGSARLRERKSSTPPLWEQESHKHHSHLDVEQGSGGNRIDNSGDDNIENNDNSMEKLRPGHLCLSPMHVKARLRDKVKCAPSRSRVSFDFVVFFAELVIHVLGPLAIPLVLMGEGVIGLRNRQFIGCSFAMVMQHATWCMFTTGLLILLIPGLQHPNIHLAGPIFGMCFFTMRNLVIAVKYAYMSEFQQIERRARVLTRAEISKTLLIPGWERTSDAQIIEELEYAQSRTETALVHSFFVFEESGQQHLVDSILDVFSHDEIATMEARNAAIHEASVYEGVNIHSLNERLFRSRKNNNDKTYLDALAHGRIAAPLFVHYLLRMASSRTSFRHHHKIALFVALMHAMVPVFGRAVDGTPLFGSNACEVILVVFSMIIFIPNMYANLEFILVGMLDYKRRIFVRRVLSEMLSESRKCTGFSVPALVFQQAHNVGLWLDCRRVLHDFGRQFFYRVQLYASLWAGLILALMLWIILSWLSSSELDYELLVMSCVEVVIIIFLLVWMLSQAQTLTRLHFEQELLLYNKSAALEKVISEIRTIGTRSKRLSIVSTSGGGSGDVMRRRKLPSKTAVSQQSSSHFFGEYDSMMLNGNGNGSGGNDMDMNLPELLYDSPMGSPSMSLPGSSTFFDKTELCQLEQARNMFNSAVHVLTKEHALYPIRILGFSADQNFSRLLLTVVGTLLIAVVRLL